MDLSERNKKVAISRWSKLHVSQKNKIYNSSENIILKSAICGFLAGDGSVQVRKENTFYHYQIDFFPDDKLMLNEYLKAFEKVYNKTPSVRRRDNVFIVRVTSKVILCDLKNIASFGLHSWTVPSELFNIEGAKEAWLRAFFSAEAHVNNKCIKIQTINAKGMKKVSDVLNQCGIDNKLYSYLPKNKNYSKVYIVLITNKDARRKYYDTIGFSHSKKTNLLRKAVVL